MAVRGGKTSTATVLHLRGLDGIEKAPGLPDGARRLLEMHVRTLPAGESDHYIVNVAMAEEFIRAHPVPPDVKPADSGDDHSGCDKWTMHCAAEVAAHIADQTSEQFEKLRQDAVKAWDHATGEVAHQWNAAEGCFADKKLPLPPVPVQFQITPSMSLHLEQSGSKDVGGGSASGTVQGTVTLGFPMQSDFHVQGDLFYIPCLPFVIRPRSVSGAGLLTIGEQLKTTVSATGKFDKVFTIPPSGGPVIPIEVIPIMIGDVPVAEVDISAYIEGNIEVGGQGAAEGHFEVTNPHKAAFDFACSGGGCNANSKGMPDPTTAEEGASIKGSVFVRPDIFTALQVDFDYDALGARAGPQPYLLGTASGCAAVAAGQTVGGPATSSENHALTADLDWGVDLRAEALVGGQRVGNKYQHSFTGDKHLWFRDLAPGGSNALVAAVDAVGTPSAGKPSAHKVRMPSCYPYTNPVRYHVVWTGGATPGATPACQWQIGQGMCTADPTKDLLISLTWPSAGGYSLSVVAVSDNHQRTFTPPPPPTQVLVTVKP
jgi:hypothetical protein